MTMISLRYDFRNRPGGPATHDALFQACLDQCAWGEEHGIDMVVISEHHGSPDGYLPAPLTLAAAITGRTARMSVNIAAALLPLHDPVRFAEQLAVVDNISRGRVSVVLGAGYRTEEFEMAGVDRTKRGKLMDEYIDVLLKSWTGEPFEWQGRTIVVTPKPFTQPHPMILLGGSAIAMARRAARFRLPFFPPIGDQALADAYLEEAAKVGFEHPYVHLPASLGAVFVSDDPERDWDRLGPYILHDANMYHAWQTPDVRSGVHVEATDLEGVKASGVYRILTPDECVAFAGELGPMDALLLHPLLGGIPPEIAQESLDLLAAKVLPQLGKT
jgi:alkanesulfonate monooxygenase SsuD/methylene tetrahydromethanopterin reductase-like flavin-dependent oxidoreductase (luciferase family)